MPQQSLDPSRRRRTSGAALVRESTDQAVLAEVLAREVVTRAEVAAATSLSKPTVSASFVRLEDAGLVAAVGARTGLRGRVATDYALAPQAGWVLALDVDQEGVRAWSADLRGNVVATFEEPPVPQGDTSAMVKLLRAVVRRAVRSGTATHGPVRTLALSVANAVSPVTGEVLALPETPFAEGIVSPTRVFSRVVDAPVLVDNHVNLAVLAERAEGAAVGLDDVAYVFVGAGIGAGLVVGGRIVRGARGLAGEVAYLAAGSARGGTLVSALGAHGLLRPGTTALDVERLRELLAEVRGSRGAGRSGREAERAVRMLGTAVGQVVADITAVVDPALVLLGGPLGVEPALMPVVREVALSLAPAAVAIDVGRLGETAPVRGALRRALDHARAHLLDAGEAARVGDASQ